MTLNEHGIIHVVAESSDEFHKWTMRNEARLANRRVKAVRNAKQIRTMEPNDEVVLCRRWKERLDWREIYNALIARGRAAGRRDG